MPRNVWSDGEEIIETDLSGISAQLERELYDRILYELTRRQTDYVFADSFTCSNVNATTSQVKAGNGLQYDSSQVDPEPLHRLLYLDANTNVTHAAADPSNNRIDIICIKADRAGVLNATRNYKDPTTGNISPTTVSVESDWESDLSVVEGTPSGSPAVPATPSGYIKLSEVLVAASTGIAGSGSYTDKRPRYQQASSWSAIKSVNTAYTLDLDDSILLVDASGGARTITLPAAALCTGKTFKIKKYDAGSNAVTVQANGAELIDGQNTQAIATQYTALSMSCDGTSWYLF